MQGMLVNLLDYLPEDSYYMQYVNASLKNRMAVTAADGNIYGFADGMKSVADAGTQHCWAVRFDTLEEHGISVPTSMEEILDVARQLKELYPDSYPVTIGEKDLSRWFQLYSSALAWYTMGKNSSTPRANMQKTTMRCWSTCTRSAAKACWIPNG